MNKRKNIRCKAFDYSTSGYYFVTICTVKRECILSTVDKMDIVLTDAGIVVENELYAISDHFKNIELIDYVIMPNHIHFVVHIENKNKKEKLGDIIKVFKSLVTKRVGYKIWQRNYYDHIIRDENDYANTLQYIQDNPLKWHFDKENPVSLNP